MVIHVFIKNIFIVNTPDFAFTCFTFSDYNTDIVLACERVRKDWV